MELTQELLNEPVRNISGEKYPYDKDKDLTYRLLMIEVILSPDKERKGDERIRGFELASKLNAPHGVINIDDAGVKLIQTRMDNAPVVLTNDYLYGLLNQFLSNSKGDTDGGA